MRLLVFTLAGMTALIFAYGLGLGGTVGAVIGGSIFLLGIILHGIQPLLDWLTEP